jgi:hypothetical protein
MSYDLAVFEPRDELRERSTFLSWYHARTGWKDGLDYSDPRNATAGLQAWYREMIGAFPPLNGPDRPADMEECTADYCVGADIIYVAFSGGRGELAYDTTARLAAKHGVGFFNASGDSAVWFPTSDGRLEIAHEHRDSDPPGRIAQMMNEAIARHGAVRVDTMEEALAVMQGMHQDPKGAKPIVIKGRKPDEGEGPT